MVDDFCLAQGNMREALYMQQLRHAKWSWKDVYRGTIYDIKKTVLPIDCHNDTITLPNDCERVINLSVIDCRGILHPLGFNTALNTAEIRCLKSKCTCDICGGKDTLCGAIDSISATTVTVNIQGTDYTQTIYTKYAGDGIVQTQTTTPSWDTSTGTVIYNTTTETICNVETTDKGCIKATRPNMDLLRTRCGCGNFFSEWQNQGFFWENRNVYRELIPSAYNYWGEWNYNAADRQIIHIFGGHERTHFGHTVEEEHEWRLSIRQIILSYQTNGEVPECEILVPEYAVEAVQIGMVYRQKYLNPRIGEGDKLNAKYAFRAAKQEVFKFLNPVRMEDITKMQTAPRPW